MSRITKEEIEKTKCGRFLLSDENIYLSIYSLNSYVFEYNLLNTEDRILYHRLQDKFDARLINGVITRVREQIIELFDKDKYIEAKVYFKPKKLSENGELEFRPLHSTGLITQIAIVSMLHLFVYEIPEEEEGDPKLRLSNLSRLIPSDFYGNRVSVKPEYLFKPWKQQYQKYNQNSNDALMKYHTSLEYKYEVTLDLENFFPTINPIIIYRYIINHLPAYLNDEERKMMKRVLQKLLFCKLTTTFDEKTAGQYYKVTKGAGNYDNVDKIEQNEKECWAFKEKSDKFVRGIPQGLPQSYFLGNIYMISIAEIFRKKFTGVSYFYVDDSVIFTNDVREDNFKEQLKELNKQIADEANNFEDDSAIYPEGTEKFYKSDLYGVNVHLDGKSNYTRLDKGLNERYDRMAARVRDIENPGCIEKDTKFYFLKEELLRIYCNAVVEKCYFCNSNYKNENSMEVAAFKSLFNFQNIPAMRELDDNESDSSKGISKRVIALLKDNDTWVEATKKLPDLLMADIEDSGAKKEIKNSSIKSLDDTIRDISKTSGGHIGKLQLEMDVKEQDVEEFIRRITRAKYDVEGLLLNEESQGLGFSNLIYLHMRLEEFYKSIDKNKVNVFFIEEPESHMHPQMQNVFIRFLKNYYVDKKLQGLITTHSNEIARMVGLDSLRVIRQTEKSKSELFDLSKFRNSIKKKKIENLDDESEFLLANFFDWFFEIGYSELIFADKVILYEGDSERLYIRKLIKLPEFSALNDSYIAFIQVGGAYAHNYLPMLRML